MSREKYCQQCDIYYVGPACPQYHPAASPRDLDAIEAALNVANRRTDIFDAAWAAVRRLRAGVPASPPESKGLDLEAVLRIGGMMANVFYNICQRPEAAGDYFSRPDVQELQRKWDEAARRLRAGAEGGDGKL